MISIGLKREPYWLDLGMGVRVQVRPYTSAIFYAARAEMMARVAELQEHLKQHQELGGVPEGLPDLSTTERRQAFCEQEFIKALARNSIFAWEGVLDDETGAPAPVTADTINALMDELYPLADAFGRAYSGVRELLEAEKKSLSSASDGISATGRNTAGDVPSSTPPAAGENPTPTADAAPITSMP